MAHMALFAAGAPELVRSNQKDRFYTDHLTSMFSDISRQVLPLRLWLRWQREFQLLAELGYYAITTALGNQTLGEEYCNLIQVTSPPANGRYLAPGFVQRTFPIIFQTLGLYVIEKTLEVFYKRIRDRNLGSLELSERSYGILERIVETVEDIFSIASRLHLALFYMHGLFYHLGKRLASVRYLMVRYSNPQAQTTGSSPMSIYRVLGWIIIIQILMKTFKWFYRMLYDKNSQDKNHTKDFSDATIEEGGGRIILESSIVESRLKCPLCLENNCSSPTSTICGHIFCWSCIGNWTSEKSECPVCRTTVKPQQLVCLQFFG